MILKKISVIKKVVVVAIANAEVIVNVVSNYKCGK
jgi:hypothetical protein